MLGVVASARASSSRLRSSSVSVPAQRVRPLQHAGSMQGVEGGVAGRAATVATGERGADEDVLVGRQALERARDLGGARQPHRGTPLRAQSCDVLRR